uniref:Agenet-like domain-containing protein n=1 Tax=Steinernema glaseri TaxID=37863 RepID=A0A1I7Y741_9BILA
MVNVLMCCVYGSSAPESYSELLGPYSCVVCFGDSNKALFITAGNMQAHRATPAVVLKLKPEHRSFLFWATEKRQLLELKVVEGSEVKPGDWVNVKYTQHGAPESYSELLDSYTTKAGVDSLQVRCVAKTASQEYARQHKKRRAVFNHRLGWAMAPKRNRKLVALLEGPNTTFEAVIACVLRDDFFIEQYQKYGTIWTLLEVSVRVDRTTDLSDVKARM